MQVENKIFHWDIMSHWVNYILTGRESILEWDILSQSKTLS